MPRTQRQRGRHRPRVSLEMLERRDVPATWGLPWADPQHLTLSLAPDGTNVEGEASQLASTLNAEVGPGWQTTILKAIQTWASTANVNVGVVSDDGAPIGTAGPAQGDPRFGDIRISAAPLSGNVLAITTPYDPSTGTLSGDVILNSNIDFNPNDSGSYDLYTVVLHEAGHIFGFADSSSPSSFMYDVYNGTQSGLLPGASAAMQALYGTMTPDPSEQPIATVNPTRTVNLNPSNPNQPGVAQINATLSSNADVDLFSYKPVNQASYLAGMDIQVDTAGISLLTPTVTVYDAHGNVVGQASASGPLAGGVTVHVGNVVQNGQYTIAVTGSADVFGDGAYQLSVSPTGSLGSTANLSGAKGIPNAPGPNPAATPLLASNTISSEGQSDLYNFTAPIGSLGVMNVQLAEWGLGLAFPQVTIYNASGVVVAQGSATSSSNGVSFTAVGIIPGMNYFARVTAGLSNSSGIGLYRLSLGFTGGSNQSNMTYAVTSSPPGNGIVQLQPVSPQDNKSYQVVSSLTSTTPTATYSLNVPGGNTDTVLTATVEGLDQTSFAPDLTVTDQKGNPVAFQVLAAEGGTMVLQIDQSEGKQYLLHVSGGQPGATTTYGNYFLGVTLGTTPAVLQSLASGTVGTSASDPGISTSISADTDQLFRFILDAAPGASGSAVQMSVINASGQVVESLTSAAGQVNSLTTCLPTGSYTVVVKAVVPQSGTVSPVVFALTGSDLSDPMKASLSSSSGSSGSSKG